MKTFRLGLAAALVASAFSAQAATTITVALFPELDKGVKASLDNFKKANPDIDVKIVALAHGDHHTAMTTALATGSNLPDVMAVDVDFIGRFAESNGLEDLSKPPYNGLQYRDKSVKYTWQQAVSAVNGLAGMPLDIGPGTLFYRKDLFDKAGVSEADLNKSWEGFIEAGKKLKSATGAYLLANASDIEIIYIRSNLKDGEGIYFDTKGKPLVDSPRFQKAFELAKAVRTNGLDAKALAWSNEWSEGFKRDKIASQMMGAWLAGHLKNWLDPDHKGLWRSSMLPAQTYASYGGSFYSIPKKAPNKEAAWKFVQFMTQNKDAQIGSLRSIDAFPALIEAQKDSFVDTPMDYLGNQKARQLWRDIASHIPAIRVDKFDSIAQEIVNAELENVLERGKDIKAALADAKAMVERRVRR